MSEPVIYNCPFCGKPGKYTYRNVHLSKWRHSIECTSTLCAAVGPVEDTVGRAITAWNTRAYEPDQARIAELTEALREIRDQDDVEIALDPDWPRRIAGAALEKRHAD